MAQTVMVIEDHAISREGLTLVLYRHGYEVLSAQSAGTPDDGHEAGRHSSGHVDAGAGRVAFVRAAQGHDGGRYPVHHHDETILTREWAQMQKCAGFLKKPIEEQDLLGELRNVLPSAV